MDIDPRLRGEPTQPPTPATTQRSETGTPGSRGAVSDHQTHLPPSGSGPGRGAGEAFAAPATARADGLSSSTYRPSSDSPTCSKYPALERSLGGVPLHVQQQQHAAAAAAAAAVADDSIATHDGDEDDDDDEDDSSPTGTDGTTHGASGAGAAGAGGGLAAQGAAGAGADAKKPRACEACRGLKVRCDPDPANPEGPCKRCAKAGRQCVITRPTRRRQKKTDSRVAELEKKIDALTASLHATRGGGGGDVVGVGGAGAGAGAGPALSSPSSGTPGSLGAGIGLLGAMLQPQPDAKGSSSSSSGARYGVSPAIGHKGSSTGLGKEWSSSTGASSADGGSGMRVQQPFTMDVDTPGRAPPVVMAGQKRKHAETRDRDSAHEDGARGRPAPPASAAASAAAPPASALAAAAAAAAATPRVLGPEPSDVIDRGVLDMERATGLFRRYTDHMVHHLPAVVFAEGTTAAEVRKTKPILFLAILSASSSEDSALQRTLVRELMHTFADKVIVTGEKSLELVQALQVAVIWYWPPEHFEELKFYQLVHIAAVMAIDIGLGRARVGGRLRRHLPYTWRDHPFKKHPPPDPTSLEARRAWLVCYFLSSNTSMALHRPLLVRWTPFMTECVDVLESSPAAAPTDRSLCHFVWTHRLAEEIGISFSMDDPATNINIADTRTQHALRGFERDLDKHRKSIPPELEQPTLALSFHVLSLYMHEIALHNEKVENGAVNDSALTTAHISALSACLTAVDGIFDTFMVMDVADIRCLPVFNFVRVAYAVVVLIKMYFAASSPGSELGKVISKDNMRVEQHLENLLNKFRATAAQDRSRPAAKFLIVLVMLRSWFHRQRKGSGGSKGADGAAAATPAGGDAAPPSGDAAPPSGDYLPGRADGGGSSSSRSVEPATFSPLAATQPPRGYPTTANTPLQLLSEVATNGPAANGSPSSATPATAASTANPAWSQPYLYDGSAANSANAGSNADMPWLGATAAAGADAGPFLPADFDAYGAMPTGGLAGAVDLTMNSLTDGLDGIAAADGSFGLDPADPSMRYMMNEPWFGEMMGPSTMFPFG